MNAPAINQYKIPAYSVILRRYANPFPAYFHGTPKESRGVCYVCRMRQVESGGIINDQWRPSKIAQVCDDPVCQSLAAKVYRMPLDKYNAIERQSILDGGAYAGAYLDRIGKTDLAKLSEDEWEKFCREFCEGIAVAMRENYGKEFGDVVLEVDKKTFDRVKDEPLVKAALKLFPGSKIVSVGKREKE